MEENSTAAEKGLVVGTETVRYVGHDLLQELTLAADHLDERIDHLNASLLCITASPPPSRRLEVLLPLGVAAPAESSVVGPEFTAAKPIRGVPGLAPPASGQAPPPAGNPISDLTAHV